METVKYIALEGIDGAGKSTQVALLSAWLTRRFLTPVTLCEPSYGRYGLEIRKRLVDGETLTREEQIRLFTLDRKEHVENKIRPLLAFMDRSPGFAIVQDRCYLSAPAYQAEGQSAMIKLLRSQQAIAPKPDIVFLIDAPVEVALQRIAKSGKRPVLFENPETLEQVRRNYLYLAEEGSERIEVVDGNAPSELVCARIVETLSK